MDEKTRHSLDVIREAVEKYWPKLSIACSFGKDSMVVVHLARRVRRDIPVFTVMTPFKPGETVEYKDRMRGLWNMRLAEYFQKDDIGAGKGHLWMTDPDRCCDYFKVGPVRRAVRGLDAWICGLRNTEGGRLRGESAREVEVKEDGLVKINPILGWTELDVWRYLAVNRIPVNPLYAEGYRSLGCAPCSSLPAGGDEPERAGRWRGTGKTECGIHCAARLRD